MATPETFSSRRLIRSGDAILHQPPDATANRKKDHQIQKSPK
jgi:hypothetical protein